MLRDRLVVGISDTALQQWLLSRSWLNLLKATEIALAREAAIKGSKTIQDVDGTPQLVNPIFNPPSHHHPLEQQAPVNLWEVQPQGY